MKGAEYAHPIGVEEGRREGKWIDVKERFPEPGCMVLVSLEDETLLTGRYYSNGWGVFFADGESLIYPHEDQRQVTHWQPLPFPPKQ
jgi:hypothetical protein